MHSLPRSGNIAHLHGNCLGQEQASNDRGALETFTAGLNGEIVVRLRSIWSLLMLSLNQAECFQNLLFRQIPRTTLHSNLAAESCTRKVFSQCNTNRKRCERPAWSLWLTTHGTNVLHKYVGLCTGRVSTAPAI